ncbi:hypothetical protein BHE74_00009073 [Ensete ventricosum]|nr:hypothetical protein BHE74_00009073 [Ensete ventricosum]
MSRVFGGCRVLMAAAKVGTKEVAAAPVAASAAPSKLKGFQQPHPVSPAMKKFLGVPVSSRSEVVKKVWEHIKANQLQPVMTKLYAKRPKGTNPLIWIVAIVCAILAIAVIITGIVVFAIYVIYHPKMPYIKVAYAHLDQLGYDPSGLLEVQMALKVVAENDNKKAVASVSDATFVLRFHGIDVAVLQTDPFDVAKNSSAELDYLFRSSPISLDKEGMEAMRVALNRGVVPFDFGGHARTRWRVGIFFSVRFWARISCHLNFLYSNGSAVDLDCSSKSR